MRLWYLCVVCCVLVTQKVYADDSCKSDLNQDGVVDFTDFLLFASAYGDRPLGCGQPTTPADSPRDTAWVTLRDTIYTTHKPDTIYVKETTEECLAKDRQISEKDEQIAYFYRWFRYYEQRYWGYDPDCYRRHSDEPWNTCPKAANRVHARKIGQTTATVQWEGGDNAERYTFNIFHNLDRRHQPRVVRHGDGWVVLEDLLPNTEYTITVTTHKGGYKSWDQARAQTTFHTAQ